MFNQLFKLLVIGHAKATDIPGATLIEPVGDDPLKQVGLNIIDWALYIGGAIAVIYIIYGGIIYITSAGDQEKTKQARTTVTNAIIGIIIISLSAVILAWTNNIAIGTTP